MDCRIRPDVGVNLVRSPQMTLPTRPKLKVQKVIAF